ncbi:MAG: hypothetical protein U0W24_00260 [Bacteroidales bacterium]
MLVKSPASGKILYRLSETLEGREAENLFEDRPAALRFCENRNNILPGALTFFVSFLGQAKKESIKIQIKSNPYHFNSANVHSYVRLLSNDNQIYRTVMILNS